MPQGILAFGSNGNFQLGLGHDNDVSIAERITADFDGNRIKQIISGGNHTLFISENGKVYGSGNNNNGQLSYKIKEEIIKIPTRLDLEYREGDDDTIVGGITSETNDRNVGSIVLAAAGWEFSIFITNKNQILSCGKGPKGELGVGLNSKSHILHKIKNFPPHGTKVLKVSAGLAHVVALLDNNTVWGWGSSRNGQLGEINSLKKVCSEPVLMYSNDRDIITDISCGRQFTVIGLANTGEIIILGNNKWIENKTLRPPGIPFKSLDSGWSAIHCLELNSSITSYGNNSHFQHHPPSLPGYKLKLAKLIDGSEHSVVITEDNTTAFTWGWGEHGNCGLDGIPDNNKLYKLYSSNTTNTIINIYCGHASTWIVVKM